VKAKGRAPGQPAYLAPANVPASVRIGALGRASVLNGYLAPFSGLRIHVRSSASR
jgi:hypothetical protein